METTRKHPRTLTEAFGPYARADFDNQDPMPTADKIVVAVSAIGAVIVLGMMLVGLVK